ncbi:hypothetical protein GCM10023195_80490 [Actinoallomurus liliacearum]|uniref:Uncharacterized protein n=1 Tax=Actinoallomurus liliacearum TaxID=1080073 RepID=A0ABP8U0C6_9ACTN
MRSARRTRRFVTILAAGTALTCGALTGTATAAPTPGGGPAHPDQADNGVFPGDQDVLNTDTYKKLLAQKR